MKKQSVPGGPKKAIRMRADGTSQPKPQATKASTGSTIKDASKVHASTRAKAMASLDGGSTYSPKKGDATKIAMPNGTHIRYEPHSKKIGSSKQPPKPGTSRSK